MRFSDKPVLNKSDVTVCTVSTYVEGHLFVCVHIYSTVS